MIFGEWIYGVFLMVAALAFRALPQRARPWWLAACGLAFYAYYSPAFVWLFIGETLVVYLLVGRAARQRWSFAVALGVAVGVLVVYKYGRLLGATAHDIADSVRLGGVPDFPRLVLPLAISFFTFEFIHYIVEARRGTLPEHRPVDFFAFMLFFPTMVAGPIKRFGDFQPQLAGARATAEDVSQGGIRIAVGLAKKVLIADTLGPLATPLLVPAAVASASSTELAVGLIAYAIRIYMDFSGYSDIAIGSARLFGIRVPENFAWPYLRSDIARFWRSWHMSLTSWITDYVYKPLGGDRRGLALTLANTLAAFAVSGIWHGAQWHFLAWGAYHGVLLCLYRLWRVQVVARLKQRVPALAAGGAATALGMGGRLLGVPLTFVAVTLGWGLFVMPMDAFLTMLGRIV